MDGDLTVQGGASARFSRTETSTAELRQNLLADPISLLEQETIADRAGNSGNLDLNEWLGSLSRRSLGEAGHSSHDGRNRPKRRALMSYLLLNS